jgi:hypothetical protein
MTYNSLACTLVGDDDMRNAKGQPPNLTSKPFLCLI